MPLSNYAKARIIIYIITFLLSLLGNGCVVLVTFKKILSRQSVTAFKLLITHLAFVDFLVSCNTFVLIPNELNNAEADDGLPMCTFKRMLRQAPLTASIATILIIAIERYRGIAKDFRYRKWTVRRVCVSLVIVWIISIGIYIPSMVWLKTTRGTVDCKEVTSLQNKRIYAVFLITFEYVVPLAIIAFCNYKIITVIRRRSRAMTEVLSDENKQRDLEQRKTTRILIAIVIGFAILALPNQIFFAYLDIADKRGKYSETWDVLQMLGILLLLHTSFNAAVYSIMDNQFRTDAKELCCCCNKKAGSSKRTSSSTSSTSANKSGSRERHAMSAV